MQNETEQLIAQGFHNEAFDAVLREWHFEQCVDLWSGVVQDVYETAQRNIQFFYHRDNGLYFFLG
jgi:hypothetical protein